MTSEKIPAVNWPQNSGAYKVVQVIIDEQPYLRFGNNPLLVPKERHGDILEKLLIETRVPFETETMSGRKLPCQKGNGYEAVGMGLCFLLKEGMSADFSDMSYDYGLLIDGNHLINIQKLELDWTIRKID